jgi:hypothetical protein
MSIVSEASKLSKGYPEGKQPSAPPVDEGAAKHEHIQPQDGEESRGPERLPE